MEDDLTMGSVAQWSRWVEELAAHPLDRFEYQGLLECRDAVEQRLQTSRNPSEASSVYAADAEFERLTIAPDGSDSISSHERWWRDRLPADPRWREYLEKR